MDNKQEMPTTYQQGGDVNVPMEESEVSTDKDQDVEEEEEDNTPMLRKIGRWLFASTQLTDEDRKQATENKTSLTECREQKNRTAVFAFGVYGAYGCRYLGGVYLLRPHGGCPWCFWQLD
jgi:hypothetical protein